MMNSKILIVDDDSTNIYMLETLLKGNGFSVVTAKNGEEALSVARESPPRLIISDILMPVMDGYQLCHIWKVEPVLKDIPFLFYTATYVEKKDEIFALDLGVDRFMRKPQDPEILMKIIGEVLDETYIVRKPVRKPLGEEMEFFRQYNEILFKKLEKKMFDLEERNEALRILEERYRLSFQFATDLIYSIDNNLILTDISPSIEQILGYTPENLRGKEISRLKYVYSADSAKEAEKDILSALKGKPITGVIYQCITKEGEIKHIEVNISPIQKNNKIIGTISVARNIEERIKNENKIQMLLREKELMLKEVHHRIKNNMNTMMGLLSLQFDSLQEPSTIAAMKDAMSRLETMRILYDKLYLHTYQNKMSAHVYLVSLVEEIVKMFAIRNVPVETQLKIEDFELSVQILTPLGIIINEIITNSMKYAFKGKSSGRIVMEGSLIDGTVLIIVEDDGIGIPDGVDGSHSAGFGLNMIDMLVEQLQGSIHIEREKGTKFILKFPV